MSGDRVSKHNKAAERIKIEQRRRTVAANLLAGATYREIARLLNVSPATVARDVKLITEEWREHYATQFDSFRELQLQRLDMLLNSVWSKAVRSDTPNHLSHIEAALRIMDRMNNLSAVAQADEPGTTTRITMVEVRKPVPLSS